MQMIKQVKPGITDYQPHPSIPGPTLVQRNTGKNLEIENVKIKNLRISGTFFVF